MHYDGSRWSDITTPSAPLGVALHGVTGASKHDVWIVGDSGTILYYDGTSWTRWQDTTRVPLRGIWFDPETAGMWIVGDKGVILHRGPATR